PAVQESREEEYGRDRDQYVEYVVPYEEAEVHDRLGQGGEGRPHVLEHFGEDRDHEYYDDCKDEYGNADDDGGVDHRSFYLPFYGIHLFEIRGEPLENDVENAARLARPYELRVEVAEDLRMLAEGLGERGAALDVFLYPR